MSACKVMYFFGKPLSFLQCRSPARLPYTDVYNMIWAAPPDGMPGGCVPDTKLPARRLNLRNFRMYIRKLRMYIQNFRLYIRNLRI